MDTWKLVTGCNETSRLEGSHLLQMDLKREKERVWEDLIFDRRHHVGGFFWIIFSFNYSNR
jgi:hypothetical protein